MQQPHYIKHTMGSAPTYLLGDSAYATQETIHYLNTQNIIPVCPKFRIKHYNAGTQPTRNSNGLFSPDSFETLSNPKWVMCPAKQILRRGKLQNKSKRVPFYEYTNPYSCRKCPVKKYCTTRSYKVLKRGLYDSEVRRVDDFLKTPTGYNKYKERMGIVEPVFGNIKWNKGFKLTCRGLAQVKTQFKLACIMHNIEKIAKCISYLPSEHALTYYKMISSFFTHSFNQYLGLFFESLKKYYHYFTWNLSFSY